MNARQSGMTDGANWRIAHELSFSVLSGRDLLQFAERKASLYRIGAIFSTERTETSESDYLVSFLQGYKGVNVSSHQEEEGQPKEALFTEEMLSTTYGDNQEEKKKQPLWTRLLNRKREENNS